MMFKQFCESRDIPTKYPHPPPLVQPSAVLVEEISPSKYYGEGTDHAEHQERGKVLDSSDEKTK